jgi:hypothetical protein
MTDADSDEVAVGMYLMVQGKPSRESFEFQYHQCMTPRVRSTRGVINPPLVPSD